VELPFGLEDVKYVIGEKWQQRFITETVEGELLVLPGQVEYRHPGMGDRSAGRWGYRQLAHRV
jgi:hypothetical protein